MSKKTTHDQQRFAFVKEEDNGKEPVFSHRVSVNRNTATDIEQRRVELLESILLELRLLNARYEETNETYLTRQDIENDANFRSDR